MDNKINPCNDLLNIKSVVKKNEKIYFKILKGECYELPFITLADPGYEQTFKKIFTGENEINGIKGEDLLKSLINNLFFPDAKEDGVKVQNLNYLPNERTEFNDTNTNVGLLEFDIVCKCICCTKKKYRKIKNEIDDEDNQKTDENDKENNDNNKKKRKYKKSI